MRNIITKACFDRYVSGEAKPLFSLKIGLHKLNVTLADADVVRVVGTLTVNDRAKDALFFLYDDFGGAKQHAFDLLEQMNEDIRI